ncbi:pyocin knob domain-containing protein [Chryseobacterium salviniae]|uniref:Pyocin knob domain-containing protein n=1 Tax=Chryseobacterium salviniae TaxID=3101750 RepID=A0ABU6HR36_9FLAO|nr:pyocin knob domain-containing protein [Chryseobacterium sp. T9W2-O]MEC3874327.1 pyocin knob domain-containing protein [Chryseobacterium sp. T9W2-O]
MDVNYAYYTTAKGYRIVNGTAAQFLKADGSVDSAHYIPINTEINMADKNINFTTGIISRFENNSRVFNNVFQKFTNSDQTGILSFKFPQATQLATMLDVTIKIFGWQGTTLGTIKVAFYKITAASINNKHKAIIECSDNFPSTVINAGIDASGNVCINIGESNTMWGTYLKAEVERVTAFYSGANFDWSKGWNQTIETDVSGYTTLVPIATEVVATKSWADQNNLVKNPGILGSADLNTLLTPGFYSQATNAGSTLANNYPSDGLFAGSLRVYKTISSGIVQEYQTRTSGGTVTFIRSTENNGTSWTGWKKVLTSLDFNPSNYYTKNESLNLFVGKNGVETINDTKTFAQSPVIPNGTVGTHAVNLNQLNGKANALENASGIGFSSGNYPSADGSQYPYIYFNNGGTQAHIPLATQDYLQNNFLSTPNGTSILISGSDLNNYLKTGFYRGSGLANAPMNNGGWWYVSVETHDSSWVKQTATAFGSGNNPNITYQRTMVGGKWTGWVQIWTTADFNLSNIQQWNYAYQYGLKLNEEFTVLQNTGLILADDYFGAESGIIDHQLTRLLAAKYGPYYFYGSEYGKFDGLNFEWKNSTFGMGMQPNDKDKLIVNGSVKALRNFKSEEERPDTLFIPNGETADLRDEIINDESEYAIRLDPHEYYIDPSGYLEVNDRNRLIHIIGEETKMVVNFKDVHPKQQIVIYNFDENGGALEVRIQGNKIYYVDARCFLKLYVTKSLRVIAERQQPCDMVW